MSDLPERAQWNRVANAVPDEDCVLAVGLKGVRVLPERVRAAHLDVDEPHRWLPDVDPRAPAEGNPMQLQAVVDQCADAHLDRPRRDHLETHPGRRDHREVACLGVELECQPDRQLEPLSALEYVNTSGAHETGCLVPSVLRIPARARSPTRLKASASSGSASLTGPFSARSAS